LLRSHCQSGRIAVLHARAKLVQVSPGMGLRGQPIDMWLLVEHTQCSCPCKRDDTALHLEAPPVQQPGYDTAGVEHNGRDAFHHVEQPPSSAWGAIDRPPPSIVTTAKPALAAKRGKNGGSTRRVSCNLSESQSMKAYRTEWRVGEHGEKGESSDSTGSGGTKVPPSIGSTAASHLRDAAGSDADLADGPPPLERMHTTGTTVSERTEGYFENETDIEPAEYLRPRRGGECALTIDKRVVKPPRYPKDNGTRARLRAAFENFCIFSALTPPELEAVVDAVSIVTYDSGAQILHQGDMGDAMYVVLAGVVDCYAESPGKAGTLVTSRETGAIFGELSIISNKPRSLSVYARGSCQLGRLDVEVYQCLVVQRQVQNMESRAKRLRAVTLLEMLTDEQIMQLADVLKVASYEPGDAIIRQDDTGEEFFIVQSGECVATVRTGSDVQEVQRFYTGELFGEVALLKNAPRAATITALTQVEVLYLSRRRFERMLGPLSLLRERSYLNDPRKIIADYYQPGDQRGPWGALMQTLPVGATRSFETAPVFTPTPRQAHSTVSVQKGDTTLWFAVFRPTSKDAIAKMLSGMAVGKGLNIKGKSAKKNRLSGFVPFVQISDNNHKPAVERPPADAVIRIYYKTKPAREEAFNLLVAMMQEERSYMSYASDGSREKDQPQIYRNDRYIPTVFGLDVPATLVCEAYIMRPDLTPWVDWETGRPSEPAFMNMNLQASYGGTHPEVVLYQYDEANPMNPRGLLVAYAEAAVKPVVSDFDALLVGSRGMLYEPLPRDQVEMMAWTLDKAEEILANRAEGSWTERWLEHIEGSKKDHDFHPVIPKYGFGDPTSTKLISKVIAHTAPCGAVRHGAECFNFYFPQEVDNEYLIIWDGFSGTPWAYKNETELKAFLLERVHEGFCFPLNPVWPIRDPAWYEVLRALRKSDHAQKNLLAWYPEDVGILDRIDFIHADCPDGFQKKQPEAQKTEPSHQRQTMLQNKGTAGSSSEQFQNQVQARVSRVLHDKVKEYWRRRSEMGLGADSDDDLGDILGSESGPSHAKAPKVPRTWGRRMVHYCLGATGLFKPRQRGNLDTGVSPSTS